MRNRATNFFPAGKPLKCRSPPMMVFIGTTPEGCEFLVVFSLFANKKLLHKTNQEADPRSSRAPTVERQACSTR